MKRLVKNNWPL